MSLLPQVAWVSQELVLGYFWETTFLSYNQSNMVSLSSVPIPVQRSEIVCVAHISRHVCFFISRK